MKQHISKREYHPTTDQTVLPSDAYRHPGSHFVDLVNGVDKSSKILRSLFKLIDGKALSIIFHKGIFWLLPIFHFQYLFFTIINW